MKRIETWNHNGKEIVYFDLSDIKNNDEFIPVIESAKKTMSQYAHHSVYTITNLSNIAFDTKTKELATEWMAFNKPYVIYGTFIGVDGIKKMMMTAIFKLSGRTDVKILATKAQALDWIEQRL